VNEQQAREAVKPHGSVRVLHPLKGSEDEKLELSHEQKAWLDDKATDPDCLEIGPCRFLPGGTLVTEVERMFDRVTFIVDREGQEL
jgi:hypothetical protein